MLGLEIKWNPVGIKVCAGYRYMFVSNSDNLGATMDLKILTHFVWLGIAVAVSFATAI